MNEYCAPEYIDKMDIKELRKQLMMTQDEFSKFVGVTRKTIERWETSDTPISGPVTRLFYLLNEDPELVKKMELPPKAYNLRLKYYFRKQLCTIIDVDESNQKIAIKNFRVKKIYRAFGMIEEPSYKNYETFLESRCVPKERDKMKLMLRELDIPFYDPMLIIEKTKGRMVEDEFWIEIER